MDIAQARPPFVTFEQVPEEDRAASIESGNYTEVDVDFAVITPHGSKDRIYRKVSEWFPMLEQSVREERYNPAWLESHRARYAAWKASQEMPENGTALMKWPGLSPAQLRTLQAGGFRTVEDLAQMNEEGVMRVGMGGRALKQRAIDWLATRQDSGAIAEAHSALRQENDDLRLRLTSLEDMKRELEARLSKLETPVASQAKATQTLSKV